MQLQYFDIQTTVYNEINCKKTEYYNSELERTASINYYNFLIRSTVFIQTLLAIKAD